MINNNGNEMYKNTEEQKMNNKCFYNHTIGAVQNVIDRNDKPITQNQASQNRYEENQKIITDNFYTQEINPTNTVIHKNTEGKNTGKQQITVYQMLSNLKEIIQTIEHDHSHKNLSDPLKTIRNAMTSLKIIIPDEGDLDETISKLKQQLNDNEKKNLEHLTTKQEINKKIITLLNNIYNNIDVLYNQYLKHNETMEELNEQQIDEAINNFNNTAIQNINNINKQLETFARENITVYKEKIPQAILQLDAYREAYCPSLYDMKEKLTEYASKNDVYTIEHLELYANIYNRITTIIYYIKKMKQEVIEENIKKITDYANNKIHTLLKKETSNQTINETLNNKYLDYAESKDPYYNTIGKIYSEINPKVNLEIIEGQNAPLVNRAEIESQIQNIINQEKQKKSVCEILENIILSPIQEFMHNDKMDKLLNFFKKLEKQEKYDKLLFTLCADILVFMKRQLAAKTFTNIALEKEMERLYNNYKIKIVSDKPQVAEQILKAEATNFLLLSNETPTAFAIIFNIDPIGILQKIKAETDTKVLNKVVTALEDLSEDLKHYAEKNLQDCKTLSDKLKNRYSEYFETYIKQLEAKKLKEIQNSFNNDDKEKVEIFNSNNNMEQKDENMEEEAKEKKDKDLIIEVEEFIETIKNVEKNICLSYTLTTPISTILEDELKKIKENQSDTTNTQNHEKLLKLSEVCKTVKQTKLNESIHQASYAGWFKTIVKELSPLFEELKNFENPLFKTEKNYKEINEERNMQKNKQEDNLGQEKQNIEENKQDKKDKTINKTINELKVKETFCGLDAIIKMMETENYNTDKEVFPKTVITRLTNIQNKINALKKEADDKTLEKKFTQLEKTLAMKGSALYNNQLNKKLEEEVAKLEEEIKQELENLAKEIANNKIPKVIRQQEKKEPENNLEEEEKITNSHRQILNHTNVFEAIEETQNDAMSVKSNHDKIKQILDTSEEPENNIEKEEKKGNDLNDKLSNNLTKIIKIKNQEKKENEKNNEGIFNNIKTYFFEPVDEIKQTNHIKKNNSLNIKNNSNEKDIELLNSEINYYNSKHEPRKDIGHVSEEEHQKNSNNNIQEESEIEKEEPYIIGIQLKKNNKEYGSQNEEKENLIKEEINEENQNEQENEQEIKLSECFVPYKDDLSFIFEALIALRDMMNKQNEIFEEHIQEYHNINIFRNNQQRENLVQLKGQLLQKLNEGIQNAQTEILKKTLGQNNVEKLIQDWRTVFLYSIKNKNDVTTIIDNLCSYQKHSAEEIFNIIEKKFHSKFDRYNHRWVRIREKARLEKYLYDSINKVLDCFGKNIKREDMIYQNTTVFDEMIYKIKQELAATKETCLSSISRGLFGCCDAPEVLEKQFNAAFVNLQYYQNLLSLDNIQQNDVQINH